MAVISDHYKNVNFYIFSFFTFIAWRPLYCPLFPLCSKHIKNKGRRLCFPFSSPRFKNWDSTLWKRSFANVKLFLHVFTYIFTKYLCNHDRSLLIVAGCEDQHFIYQGPKYYQELGNVEIDRRFNVFLLTEAFNKQFLKSSDSDFSNKGFFRYIKIYTTTV